MDISAVYARSAKGEEALRLHRHQLRLLHRQVLFLIDGRSPLNALLDRWGALNGLDEAITFLVQHGFIEPLRRSSAAPGLPAAVPAAGPGDSPAEQVRQRLVAWLVAKVPGNSDKLVGKLRDAPASQAGLQSAVESCCRVMRLTVDEQLAGQFAEQARALFDSRMP